MAGNSVMRISFFSNGPDHSPLDPFIRCQQSAIGNSPSVVSGTAVSTAGRTEWQVVAHEIGHNFGAIVSDLRASI